MPSTWVVSQDDMSCPIFLGQDFFYFEQGDIYDESFIERTMASRIFYLNFQLCVIDSKL